MSRAVNERFRQPPLGQRFARRGVHGAGGNSRPNRGNRGGMRRAHGLEILRKEPLAGPSWTVRVKSTQYPS